MICCIAIKKQSFFVACSQEKGSTAQRKRSCLWLPNMIISFFWSMSEQISKNSVFVIFGGVVAIVPKRFHNQDGIINKMLSSLIYWIYLQIHGCMYKICSSRSIEYIALTECSSGWFMSTNNLASISIFLLLLLFLLLCFVLIIII